MYRHWKIVICLFGVVMVSMIIVNILQIRAVKQRVVVRERQASEDVKIISTHAKRTNQIVKDSETNGTKSHVKRADGYIKSAEKNLKTTQRNVEGISSSVKGSDRPANNPTVKNIGMYVKENKTVNSTRTDKANKTTFKGNFQTIKTPVQKSNNGNIESSKHTTATMKCSEKTNLVFLKVHKTGSSTIANIVQRFGLRRNLTFALPKKKPGQLRYNYFGGIGGKLKRDEILPTPMNRSFNLLYNHVVFGKDSFQRVFDNRTVFITMMREPFSQFTSALLYFLNEKLYKIATTNLTQYLANPDYFEPDNRFLSFTDNRQALDLGVPVHKVRHRRFINNYIKVLDSAFDLVMITEFFDESLILFKRLMCWSFRDILYFRKNTGYRKFNFNVTDTDIVNYRTWAMADNLIYDHFYHKFMDYVSLQPNFDDEVVAFKAVSKKVDAFCDNGQNRSRISLNRSKWSGAFDVTSLDCLYMRSNELRLHNMLYHHALNHS